MTELTEATAGDVMAELYDCDDGVVRSVRLECGRSRDRRSCVVVVECVSKDPRLIGKGPPNKSGIGVWVSAQFTVEGVSELRFELKNYTFEVLSSGIQLIWRDGSVYLLLDAHPEDGDGLPDLSRNIAYVVGRGCRLEVSPLSSDG